VFIVATATRRDRIAVNWIRAVPNIRRVPLMSSSQAREQGMKGKTTRSGFASIIAAFRVT
jgi:hypothetical protein